MRRAPQIQIPFADWPEEDRYRWNAAFKTGDPFDDCGPVAHLADRTRQGLYYRYGCFLGFLMAQHPDVLALPPTERLSPSIIAQYVASRRQSCSERTVAGDLRTLRIALRLICPTNDWSWLLAIAKRIESQAPPKAERHHLVTSDRLYALGIELMDRAMAGAFGFAEPSKAQAFAYRDGLIIALLALIPLRRRTVAALRIGKHVVKSGQLWALDIPAADSKTRRALDYPIAPELSQRIDVYLSKFRCRIPGANMHHGLWASNQSRPMDHGSIYDTVCKRTQKAFGFPVSLHRFRHAAATLWSTLDPANVRGAKDLLGHASFQTTEKHYIMSRSRLAGHALARVIDGCK